MPKHPSSESPQAAPAAPLLPLATLAYLALLVYGTLYPWQGWRAPDPGAFAGLLSLDQYASFGDIVTNLLVYIPAGLLLTLLIGRRAGIWIAAPLALFLATALSIGLEMAQLYLPHRVSSLVDVALNSASAAAGVIAAAFGRTLAGRLALQRTRLRVTSNRHAHAASLAAIGVWVGTQWAPFVPSLDVGHLWRSVAPLAGLVQPAAWNLPAAGEYLGQTVGLGVLIAAISANPYRTTPPLLLLLGGVFGAKVLMIGRVLSPEAVAGALAGFILVAALDGIQLSRRALVGCLMVLGSAVLESLITPLADTARDMNWTPFRMHLHNPLVGIGAVLDSVWPYLSLAVLAPLVRGRLGAGAVIAGALACMAFAGALEWSQRWHSTRVADATDILLGGVGWLAGTALALQGQGTTERHVATRHQP